MQDQVTTYSESLGFVKKGPIGKKLERTTGAGDSYKLFEMLEDVSPLSKDGKEIVEVFKQPQEREYLIQIKTTAGYQLKIYTRSDRSGYTLTAESEISPTQFAIAPEESLIHSGTKTLYIEGEGDQQRFAELPADMEVEVPAA